jgi:hypothetical protein
MARLAVLLKNPNDLIVESHIAVRRRLTRTDDEQR